MDDRDFFKMTPQERADRREQYFAEREAEEKERRKRAWDNRRILSDRLHWPVGVLQECEWVERDHPDWSPWWQAADERTGRPARYTARRHCHPERGGVSGETAHELAEAIEAAPEEPTIGHLEPLI